MLDQVREQHRQKQELGKIVIQQDLLMQNHNDPLFLLRMKGSFRLNTSLPSKLISCCLVTKLCLTLCDFMNCRPPGSLVHGISQAGILEPVAISFSRDLPDTGIKPNFPTLAVGPLPLSHLGSPSQLLEKC